MSTPKFHNFNKLPVRVQIERIVSSRYLNHERPSSWDSRKDGVDIVHGTNVGSLKLWSDGGQAPPKPGWEIMLMHGDAEEGYRWTLYGMSKEKCN